MKETRDNMRELPKRRGARLHQQQTRCSRLTQPQLGISPRPPIQSIFSNAFRASLNAVPYALLGFLGVGIWGFVCGLLWNFVAFDSVAIEEAKKFALTAGYWGAGIYFVLYLTLRDELTGWLPEIGTRSRISSTTDHK
jgi:hypothetical protein